MRLSNPSRQPARSRSFPTFALVLTSSSLLALLPLLGLCGCGLEPPLVDLEGPRVVDTEPHGTHAVEVPPYGPWRVTFSEAIDPTTVHMGTVALVPWEEVDRCELTPVCEEGSCARGRCVEDPIRAGDLSALARGEGIEGSVPLRFEWFGEQTLELIPERALPPHTRFSLVLGDGIRDLAGARLEASDGEPGAVRREWTTAEEGASGPEARLVRPALGDIGVPTDLRSVVTSFARPITFESDAVLHLEDELGEGVVLREPTPCEGWVPGACARWTIDGGLLPDRAYRIAGGTLRDLHGRTAVPPHELRWFRTGPTGDAIPPAVTNVVSSSRGGCLFVGLHVDEPVEVVATVGDRVLTARGEGHIELAMRPDDVSPGDVVSVQLAIEDFVGNVVPLEVDAYAGDDFDPNYPGLVIQEVLANPRGKEPAQEFVEVRVQRGGSLAGAFLSDLPWTEIEAMLGEGEAPPGDELPAIDVEAGELLVFVAPTYDEAAPDDVPMAPGGRLIRLGSSIAQSGLANAGEPLVIYVPDDPPRLLASASSTIDTSKSAHAGRSVVLAHEQGCDLAAAWRSHPEGRSAPGRLP